MRTSRASGAFRRALLTGWPGYLQPLRPNCRRLHCCCMRTRLASSRQGPLWRCKILRFWPRLLLYATSSFYTRRGPHAAVSFVVENHICHVHELRWPNPPGPGRQSGRTSYPRSPFASLPATVCTYSGLAGLRIVEIKRSAYVRTHSPAGGLLDCDDMVGAQRRES